MSSSAQNAGFLRLPVDSARRLKWYDKAEIASLVAEHGREKRSLAEENAALRRLAGALPGGGGVDDLDARLEAELGRPPESRAIEEKDEAVSRGAARWRRRPRPLSW